MHHRWFGLLSVLGVVALMRTGCGEQERPKRRTMAQVAEEMVQVFETPVPYTRQQLDTSEVLRFVEGSAEARRDSAQIMDF